MFISNVIKTEVVTVTPRLAKSLLEQNTGNRKIASRNLGRVKAAMIRGEWVLNGEAIKISKTGRILDGQHRLHAAVETGTTFETLIVYGVDEGAQDSMDTGKSRTLADVLMIHGYKNCNTLASVVTAILRSEKWNIKIGLANTGGYEITVQEAHERVQQEPSLTEIHSIVAPLRKIGLSAKIGGFLLYKFSEIDAVDAHDFFSKLSSGEGLERGNAILTLRNALIALKTERGQKNGVYVGALVIKAWNKYRAGEEARLLRFNPGGANPEPFPEPR